MVKFRAMLVALAATAVFAAQVGVARATNCGSGTASKAILSGTYTLNFLGNNVTGVSPLAGSGSVTLDGKGDVTGGVIRCNQFSSSNPDDENDATITGGCYTINFDGTGFMAITTTDPVCGKDPGVDLQLAISFAGNQFQFSSDGSEDNSDTGESDPFSGTANRLTPNLFAP